MDCYIELRFGQIEDVQREIIPISSINTVYVDMIDQTSIVFDWTINDKTFHRHEYYETTYQCNRRWNEIRRIMGVENQTAPGKGFPIPMKSSKWAELDLDGKNDLLKQMIHVCYPPVGDDPT